jgi:hypothetical protein
MASKPSLPWVRATKGLANKLVPLGCTYNGDWAVGQFNEPTSLLGCHSTRASRRIPILCSLRKSRAIFKLTHDEKLRSLIVLAARTHRMCARAAFFCAADSRSATDAPFAR